MLNQYHRLVSIVAFGIIGLFHFTVQGQEINEAPKEADITENKILNKLHQIEDENKALKNNYNKLQLRLNTIEQQNEDAELEALIEAAKTEADSTEEGDTPEDRNFLWGALALQKLNPEISLSADMLTTLIIDKQRHYYSNAGERSGFSLREVSLHLQHTLDPSSSFKGAISFIPGPDPEVEVEEMYIVWYGILPSLSITVGQFRQNFGIVNRWHVHDLDQTSYPLALRAVLGEDGISQAGVMFKWFLPPLWAHANELIVEITNGQNETLLSGDFFSVPSAVGHLKSYWDVSDNTYLEMGLSGLWGMNNKRGYVLDNSATLSNQPWRQTIAGGVDFTLQWTPLQKAKYRSFTWRTEGFVARVERDQNPALLLTGESDSNGVRYSFGVYSYLDFKVSEQFFLGIRGDVALPTVRAKTKYAYDIVPYITFWQSEFVYLRLEYAYEADTPYTSPLGNISLRTDSRVMLQIDFAAGPHKHEKY